MSGRAAVVACALACAAWPAAARATAVSSEQLRALATAALRDPAALGRLRAIDAVDGRPVALGPALRGAGADVRERLRVLAAGEPAAPAAPARAREQARDVLDQRRFHPTSVPAPLRRVRERIGAAMRSLGRPIEDAFRSVAGWVPGGTTALSLLLGVLALCAAALVATRVAARRAAAGAGRSDGRGARGRPSAGRLRQEADDAERRGDLDLALRLRFRAGLVELEGRELVELRPALTNRELLRAVASPTLAELVGSFEAVAYGGRPAADGDLRSARDGWPRVPDEAARR